MSDSTAFSTLQKLGSLLISLVFRMTVRLTVELLKIGLILAILVFFFAAVSCFVGASVWWVYTSSDGSLSAASLALGLSLLAVYVLGHLTQFVTRDVLHLTSMSLPGLVMFLFRVMFRKEKPKEKSSNGTIELCDALFDEEEEFQQRKEK